MAAWALLQSVPQGQRSAYVARAILQTQEKTVLEETLRRVLREELQALPVSQADGSPPNPELPADPPFPPQMMDFLNNLPHAR